MLHICACVIYCLCRHRGTYSSAQPETMASLIHSICCIYVCCCVSIMVLRHSGHVLYSFCCKPSERLQASFALSSFVARHTECEMCTILSMLVHVASFPPLPTVVRLYRRCTECIVSTVSILFSRDGDRKSVVGRHACTRYAPTVFQCIDYKYRKHRMHAETQGSRYLRSKYIVYDLGIRAKCALMLIIYSFGKVEGQMMGHSLSLIHI